ncbi:MAG: delta-60 repeat domain-containing protein [Actinomycetota bacterium]|nr:delta-60 repeat domain-containing protein [Actinomycetota bacterium]
MIATQVPRKARLLTTGLLVALVGGGLVAAGGLVGVAQAAISDGTRDTAFTTNTGTAASEAGTTVTSMLVQSDRRIVLGGSFTTWDGTTVNRIVRLNSDGTRDTAFTTNTGTGADNAPFVLTEQADGKILVGGAFSTWNGTAVGRIVRLNADGTRDTAFTTNTGTAASSNVYAITVQTDGKILVGGQFGVWNGTAVGFIVRLNADGTRDTAFTTAAGTAANNTVYAITLQSDGKILVGGQPTTWNGTTVNRLVLLNSDGTRDTAFTTNAGTAANSSVGTVMVQGDGKILVGGLFTTWNGATVNRLVRLNSDGTRDTAFTTAIGSASDSNVNAVVVQSDGKILVGGNFTTWNGATANYVVRMYGDGTRDTGFTAYNGIAADGNVYAAAMQADGKILLGGSFATWNGTTVNRVVRLAEAAVPTPSPTPTTEAAPAPAPAPTATVAVIEEIPATAEGPLAAAPTTPDALAGIPDNPTVPTVLTPGFLLVDQQVADATEPRVMKNPPTDRMGQAPVVRAATAQPLALAASGLVSGTLYEVRIKVRGVYVTLGSTVPDATGAGHLPVFTPTRRGTYTVAIIDPGTGQASYVKIKVGLA